MNLPAKYPSVLRVVTLEHKVIELCQRHVDQRGDRSSVRGRLFGIAHYDFVMASPSDDCADCLDEHGDAPVFCDQEGCMVRVGVKGFLCYRHTAGEDLVLATSKGDGFGYIRQRPDDNFWEVVSFGNRFELDTYVTRTMALGVLLDYWADTYSPILLKTPEEVCGYGEGSCRASQAIDSNWKCETHS